MPTILDYLPHCDVCAMPPHLCRHCGEEELCPQDERRPPLESVGGIYVHRCPPKADEEEP